VASRTFFFTYAFEMAGFFHVLEPSHFNEQNIFSLLSDAISNNQASLNLSTQSNNQQNIVPFTKMPAPKVAFTYLLSTAMQK
jgi:hypothetical protein